MKAIHTHLMRVLLLAGALSAALAAPRAARADDWPTHMHDAQLTGRSSAALDPRLTQPVWNTTFDGPVIVGQNVIARRSILGQPLEIASRRLRDSAVNWTRTVAIPPAPPGTPGGPFLSRTASADGVLVYAAGAGGTGSLYVHDVATGTLKYTVPMVYEGYFPTLHRHRVTGELMAFHTYSNGVAAYRLGANAGTLAWSRSVPMQLAQSAAVVEDSLVAVSDGHYFAFDQATGAMNTFHNAPFVTPVNGGVSYDAARRRLYVVADYDDSAETKITAYAYNANDDIQQVWQVGDVGAANAVSIGPDGRLYHNWGSDRFQARHPDDGRVVRTFTHAFPELGGTPVLSDGYLWGNNGFTTSVFSLATGQRVHQVFNPFVALTDGYVVGFANVGNGAMNVYVVPEPTCAAPILALAAAARRRRWRAP